MVALPIASTMLANTMKAIKFLPFDVALDECHRRHRRCRHIIAPNSHQQTGTTLCTTLMTTLAIIALVAPNYVTAVASNATSAATGKTSLSSSSTSDNGNVKTSQSTASKASSAPMVQQSTDLSSMYVQIPIAEPVDTQSHQQSADNNGVEQGEDSGDSSSSASTSGESNKATTWTGPWPKKFQIGYIKQSDLHQVLIESLKGDPFVSLAGGGPKSGASKSSPTTSTAAPGAVKSVGANKGAAQQPVATNKQTNPSDSSSLMTSNTPKIPNGQWVTNQAQQFAQQPQVAMMLPQSMAQGKNIYRQHRSHPQQQQQQQHHPHHQQMAMFRDQMNQPKNMMQFNHHMQRFPMGMPPMQSGYFNQVNRAPFNQHSNPKLISMTADTSFPPMQQQQQFQFANSFGPNSLKNQPIYTMNNFPQQQQQQQQLDQVDMPNQQAILPQMGNFNRPSKVASDHYSSSWKPVTSDSNNKSPTQQSQMGQSDMSSINDGFDEGFGMPATATKDDSGTTNRHPMLNGYLNNNNQESTGKVSPSKMVKQMNGTKGSKSGTKSDSGATKNSEGRVGSSANNGSSTTTTTTTSASTNDTSTTMSPLMNATTTTTTAPNDDSNGTTTLATMPTTTTQSDSEDTTEPESEVIGTDTTEASISTTETTDSAMTTTASSVESASRSSTPTSSTTGSSSTTNAGDSNEEVATSGQSTPQSALPTVGSEDASSTTSSSSTTQSSSSSSTSSREETTPSGSSSTPQSSQSSKTNGGEIEGASLMRDTGMSDEALVAAAKSAEIGKAGGNSNKNSARNSRAQSSTATSGGNKRARSSERLLQTTSTSMPSSSSRKSTTTMTSTTTSSSNNNSNKLITKKPTSSSGRQVTKQSSDSSAKLSGPSKSAKASNGRQRSGSAKSLKSSGKAQKSSAKSTRMASSARLTDAAGSAPQIVSMSAAQAQSTAQTLASLLLSRCLSSANCAHLLDVCSTKQAAVPLQLDSGTSDLATAANQTAGSSAVIGWSVPVGLMSGSLMSLAQALQADRVLRLFPAWKEAASAVADQDSQSGYTLILPSNEALDRLPANQLDFLQQVGGESQLNHLIEAHILDSVEQIELSSNSNGRNPSNGPSNRLVATAKWPLQINRHRERMATINGKRVVYANQAAPGNGRIHVIDGLLEWPSTSASTSISNARSSLDIMDTLKQCDKFDGFVTLAEGTGLTQLLRQDGPLTVFVPSNEALRKIPDDELELIKNNATALREFLMYHIVNGSYFSQDLRDGQQLASILDMKPIQVGVRVDGCSRRLVEANTSPMRRPDIVAKNGVIHILDWYLTIRDNEWCDPIGRSTSSAPTTNAPNTSERLQQLGSEPMLAYATRVVAQPSQPTPLPPNHKQLSPADTKFDSLVDSLFVPESSLSGGELDPVRAIRVAAA